MTANVKEKKIKILYLLHSTFFEGGAGKSIYEIIKELSIKKEYDLEIILLDSANEDIEKKFKDLGLKITIIKKRCFLQLGKFQIGWLQGFSFIKTLAIITKDTLLSFKELKNVNKKIYKINPHIIHLNSSTLIPLAFFLPKKIKKIIHVRESLITESYMRKKLIKFFISLIDGVICISDSEYEQFKPLVKSKIRVIGNPIVSSDLSTSRSNVGSNSYIKIGCLAGHDEKKGGIFFIKSLNYLNFDFEVNYAGPEKNESNYSKNLQREINYLKNKKKIRINNFGLIENINEFILNNDLIVVPHLRPHFSRVIIESFCNFRPVVTFLDNWTKNINNKSNSSLILVKDKNEKALAKKISILNEGKILIKDKIIDGKKYWENNHRIDIVTEKIINFYKKIQN